MNYYNDNDRSTCAWLRELIAGGHIPNGVVDARPIHEVTRRDLLDYRQCHFFAGIGGWAKALALAHWPEDRPVWTGSCPCQPFSVAGKGKGVEDERHLWPIFHGLIDECRPPIVFGEQVSSPAGRTWLNGVFADLEKVGYAGAGSDLCAASVGSPHIRQRLFWVANSVGVGSQRGVCGWQNPQRQAEHGSAGRRRADGGLADAEGQRGGEGNPIGRGRGTGSGKEKVPVVGDVSLRSELADGVSQGPTIENGSAGSLSEFGQDSGLGDSDRHGRRAGQRRPEAAGHRSSTESASPWGDYEWLNFRDGKQRRIKSGLSPLAHGVSGRVGLLRGYGNAIVPQVAAEFIKSVSFLIAPYE